MISSLRVTVGLSPLRCALPAACLSPYGTRAPKQRVPYALCWLFFVSPNGVTPSLNHPQSEPNLQWKLRRFAPLQIRTMIEAWKDRRLRKGDTQINNRAPYCCVCRCKGALSPEGRPSYRAWITQAHPRMISLGPGW
jgi:hypothetical protein